MGLFTKAKKEKKNEMDLSNLQYLVHLKNNENLIIHNSIIDEETKTTLIGDVAYSGFYTKEFINKDDGFEYLGELTLNIFPSKNCKEFILNHPYCYINNTCFVFFEKILYEPNKDVLIANYDNVTIKLIVHKIPYEKSSIYLKKKNDKIEELKKLVEGLTPSEIKKALNIR